LNSEVERRLRAEGRVHELTQKTLELAAYQQTVQSYFQGDNVSTRCATLFSAPKSISNEPLQSNNGEPVPAFMKALSPYITDAGIFSTGMHNHDSLESVGQEAKAIITKERFQRVQSTGQLSTPNMAKGTTTDKELSFCGKGTSEQKGS
jgi:hypothetical protein